MFRRSKNKREPRKLLLRRPGKHALPLHGIIYSIVTYYFTYPVSASRFKNKNRKFTLKRLPLLSCRDFEPLRGIYYATHVLRFTSFRFTRRGELEGNGGREKGEREREKNQDLGWRKMAVPMQTTRRAPSSGHWTGKWRHLRLWRAEPRCTP